MLIRLMAGDLKRHWRDDLLYSFSLAMLVAVLQFSCCIAGLVRLRPGFQAAALPALVVLVLLVLTSFLNAFLIERRAKQYAVCLLAGMKKPRLCMLFLGELALIALACLAAGLLLGSAAFCLCFSGPAWQAAGRAASLPALAGQSAGPAALCFCAAQLLCLAASGRRLYRLPLIQLMQHKQRVQAVAPLRMASQKAAWGRIAAVSLTAWLAALLCAAFGPPATASAAVSVLAAPMLAGILAFYQWFYASLCALRASRPAFACKGGRLYMLARLTADARKNAWLDGTFCVCFVFSAGCFVFGVLALSGSVRLFVPEMQLWMGFLQCCLCVILLVAGLSLLSCRQLAGLEKELQNDQIRFYLGMPARELQRDLQKRLLLRLTIPVSLGLPVVWTAALAADWRLNTALPAAAQDILLWAAGGFTLCFFLLYAMYHLILCGAGIHRLRQGLGMDTAPPRRDSSRPRSDN